MFQSVSPNRTFLGGLTLISGTCSLSCQFFLSGKVLRPVTKHYKTRYGSAWRGVPNNWSEMPRGMVSGGVAKRRIEQKDTLVDQKVKT